MLKESLQAQRSIVIPGFSTVPEFNIALPEQKSPSFLAMTNLMPKTIYSVDSSFMVPNRGLIPVTGIAAPGAAVNMIVNGVNQSNPPLMADPDGNWSTAIVLGPGPNTVQVQTSP